MDDGTDRRRFGLDRVPIAEDPPRERQAIESLLAKKGGVHLLGAGGVGMAGVGVLLAGRGLDVTGCDAAPGPWLSGLEERGCAVRVGHDPSHLEKGVSWMVRTTAVPDHHPEVLAARRLGLPVYHRGKVLAALCRGTRCLAVSGTHGKTTTSSMLAHVLRCCGLDAGYCIGGVCPSLPFVAAAGDGTRLVVEADESDGTLVYYQPDVAIVANIEFDHMEHFDSEQRFTACLEHFAASARDVALLGMDDPVVARLRAGIPRAVGFGLHPDAEIRADDRQVSAQGQQFTVHVHGTRLGSFFLPAPGLHNLKNALAAVAAALREDGPVGSIREALRTFRLPQRRFETVALAQGIRVLSDYAHHPSEVRALMDSAATLGARRVLAVFQPHRYTRTAALGGQFPAAFEGVDRLWLAPVYEASEEPLPGGTHRDLLRHFQAFGSLSVEAVESLQQAWQGLRDELREGDLLLVIGAGDVDQLAGWAKAYLEGI